MPDVFHHLQELDEKRIKNIKNFMLQSVDVERNVFPIINKCLEGIVTAANAVNEKEVSLFSTFEWLLLEVSLGFEVPGIPGIPRKFLGIY